MKKMLRLYVCAVVLCIADIICSPVYYSVSAVDTNSEIGNQDMKETVFEEPWLKRNLLWSQGKEVLIGCLVVGAVGAIISSKVLITVALGAFLFSLYFFRNPHRICEEALQNDRIVVAPSDGEVVAIEKIEEGFVGLATRISIFLSPLDVHVQWIPLQGIVEQIIYRPGKFVVAYAPKSSEINERNDIYLRTTEGVKLVVRQIAGFVARRICCWVKPQTQVQVGDKYGMIRFGSRVDVIVPRETKIAVKVGDRVYGGHTALAEIVVCGEAQ